MIGEIVIVGAGGVGREVFDAAVSPSPAGRSASVRGYVDDADLTPDQLARLSAPFLGSLDVLAAGAVDYVLAIGDGETRRRIADRLSVVVGAPRGVVDASATVGSSNEIGAGVVLLPGARLSNAITVGRHVQVHVNGVVGHDAVLGDFVSIFPSATIGGSVRLGDGVTVGSGATVLPGRTIGAGAFVGAGAVVVDDVEPGVTVVGVPAIRLEPKARQR